MSGIAIIEEDKLMRGLLVEWLSAEGYSVCAAAPDDAHASDNPDLVIVDVYMPRHEGVERLRAVKAAHPQTPLIAISGQFRPGLAGSCAR
jgi:DNA-binding response OmpR family regulator